MDKRKLKFVFNSNADRVELISSEVDIQDTNAVDKLKIDYYLNLAKNVIKKSYYKKEKVI